MNPAPTPPPPAPPAPAPGTMSTIGHTALDLLGMVPVLGEPADLANAAWYAAEGNHLDAGLSLISVIPVVGDVVGKGGKLAKAMGGGLAKKAMGTLKSLDFGEILGKFRKHPQLGPHVDKIAKALEDWRQSITAKFSNGPPGGPSRCPKELARLEAAASLRKKAEQAEKVASPQMQELAGSLGMKMEGFAYRLKDEASLAKKLENTAPGDVGDALRYTMVAPPGELAAKAAKALEELQARGYEVVKVKDSFKPGAPYKGVNTQLKAPDGQRLELQFHTPQSFDVKQNKTHDLYKKLGELDPKSADYKAVSDQISGLSESIQIPPGLADSLGRFKSK